MPETPSHKLPETNNLSAEKQEALSHMSGELELMGADRRAELDAQEGGEEVVSAAVHEAGRGDRVDAALGDVHALFSETEVAPSPYEPRTLGSADGDWDFVKNQRASGSEVSIGNDLSVQVTDAHGNAMSYRTLDDARAAVERPVIHKEEPAQKETRPQPEVESIMLPLDGEPEDGGATNDVLAAVEQSIARHTNRYEEVGEETDDLPAEEAPREARATPQAEQEQREDMSHQAIEALDKRLGEALDETAKLDKRVDAILGDAHDMLRREIMKLDQMPDRHIGILAPYVTRAIGSVAETIQKARSTDRRKEETTEAVRNSTRFIANDNRVTSDIQALAGESFRMLRSESGAGAELALAFRMVQNIGTRPTDSRDDTIDRMRRLANKLDEIRQEQRNNPRAVRRLGEVKSSVDAALNSMG